MKRLVERRYQSPLRDEQAEATALRIIEAAIRVLERGLSGLSIPAVAREARVSVATVYHHFPDKPALIRAVTNHLDRQMGAEELDAVPASAAEIVEHIRFVFPRLSGRRALMAPALLGPEGTALRREWLSERAAIVRAALAGSATASLPEDFDRLVAIVTLLCTTEALGVLDEYLGLSPAEAAEAVAWAVLKLSEESTT